MVMPLSPLRFIARRVLLLAGFASFAPAVVAGPLHAQSDLGAHPLESASALYAGLETFCMDFRQRLEVPLLDEVHMRSGRLCQRSPDRIRMDFSDPAGDVVVGDGEYLWVFLPSAEPGQVIRFSLESAEGAFDVRKEFLEDPLTKYEVEDRGTEEIDGRPAHEFALAPRERARYQSAVVWVDEVTHHLRQVEIVDVSGAIRRLTFSALDAAPNLAEGAFTFLVPAGVRVVAR